MEENNRNNVKPIDFNKIVGVLWSKRKLYFIVLPLTLIITYLLTLCVPRYYSCKLEFAPEGQSGLDGSSLSSLASSFGVSGLGKMVNTDDAISSMLYPDLVKSPNFVVTLFSTPVATKDGSLKTDYYDYMAHHQKMALWDKYIISPIKKMFKKDKAVANASKVDIRTLSKEQQEVIHVMTGNIVCAIDKKTEAISLTVQDQDPVICATIGDTVMERIQAFIIEYRTKKARNDYAYYKKLCSEAKERYERSRRRYASMADSNTDVTLQSVQSKITDLENEMQLQYNSYSALATQAQAAQAKIQEKTPVFTPISTAVIPVKPAGPKRVSISILMTFLSAMVLSLVILLRNGKE